MVVTSDAQPTETISLDYIVHTHHVTTNNMSTVCSN